MAPRIAVIQFPGVNCEYETVMAMEKVGLVASIVRWNQPAGELAVFDGFVLPGGFSYEDRLRAGAIAASDDVVEVLFEQAARGKPLLGICNGAQVLVESGLVPGLEAGRIDLALAPNTGMGRDGYYANWVLVRAPAGSVRTIATWCLEPDEVIPIPIAHSQGRFTSSWPGLMDELEERGQIILRYCRPDGDEPLGFPDDPNGSDRFAAAVSNPAGNVVAIMPHPERATWLRQVPGELPSRWSAGRMDARGRWKSMESDGPCARMFGSIKKYIEEH